MERLSRSALSSEVKVTCNGDGTRLDTAEDDDEREAVFPDVTKLSGT